MTGGNTGEIGTPYGDSELHWDMPPWVKMARLQACQHVASILLGIPIKFNMGTLDSVLLFDRLDFWQRRSMRDWPRPIDGPGRLARESKEARPNEWRPKIHAGLAKAGPGEKLDQALDGSARRVPLPHLTLSPAARPCRDESCSPILDTRFFFIF